MCYYSTGGKRPLFKKGEFMKGSRHHHKSIQKKTMKSQKKEHPLMAQPVEGVAPLFKRPKTILNKRKIS